MYRKYIYANEEYVFDDILVKIYKPLADLGFLTGGFQ